MLSKNGPKYKTILSEDEGRVFYKDPESIRPTIILLEGNPTIRIDRISILQVVPIKPYSIDLLSFEAVDLEFDKEEDQSISDMGFPDRSVSEQRENFIKKPYSNIMINQGESTGRTNYEIAEVSHNSAGKSDSMECTQFCFEIVQEPKFSYKQLFSLRFVSKSSRNLQIVTRDYSPETMIIEVYNRTLDRPFAPSL